MYVDKQSVQNARTADLYAFLLTRHGELFRQCGTSIYMKSNKSLYIKAGYYGYCDFATGETGNGIDFLINHLGYTFQEAVLALSGCKREPCVLSLYEQPLERNIPIPIPARHPHKRMFAYLMSRGIPVDVIRYLSSNGLAYQEERTGNIVFINKEKDYYELRGTCTYVKNPFHGCRKTRADRFWYFIPGADKPKIAFITESAIDAVSLWLLQRCSICNVSAVYISIGGVANYATIDRISRNIEAVIAVDNDHAGETCRNHYKNLRSIVPFGKDWNEDLQDRLNES